MICCFGATGSRLVGQHLLVMCPDAARALGRERRHTHSFSWTSAPPPTPSPDDQSIQWLVLILRERDRAAVVVRSRPIYCCAIRDRDREVSHSLSFLCQYVLIASYPNSLVAGCPFFLFATLYVSLDSFLPGTTIGSDNKFSHPITVS